MTSNYGEGSTAVDGSSAGGSGGVTGQVKEQVKGQAQQAAGSAKEQAGHVAGVAQGEAGKVAAEASSQVRGLVGQATSQVEEQSRTQLGRLAEALASYGQDLGRMASSGEGPAAGLAQEAADRVTAVAAHLEGREPRVLVDDLRRFARRRPGAFLGGALVAGVVAGRLGRGAKAAHDDDSTTHAGGRSAYDAPYDSQGYSPEYLSQADVTSPGDPLAGVGTPDGDPFHAGSTGDGLR